MLSCRDLAHRHAGDYIDAQLGWRARMNVRLHLMLCENCRRFIAQLRRVRALLRDKPETAAELDAAVRDLADKLADNYRQQKTVAQKKPPPL